MTFRFVSLVSILVAMSSAMPAQATTDIEELSQLTQVGAGQLAVSLLSRYRPSAETDIDGWQTWQRRQIEVSRGLGSWEQALALLAETPTNATPEYRYWAIARQAEGLMAVGKPVDARLLLSRALWHEAVIQPPQRVVLRQQQADWLPTWRRLLIKAYLEQGLYREAQQAAALYVTDYEGGSARGELRPGLQRFPIGYKSRSLGELGRLQARVAIYDERYRDAWRLLEKDQYREAALAKQIAQLREQPQQRLSTEESIKDAALSVFDAAQIIAQNKEEAPDWRKSAAILVHESALTLKRPIAAADAVLQAVELAPLDSHGESLLRVADTWYLDALAQAGNVMLNGKDLRFASSEEQFSAISHWQRGPALAALLAIATNGADNSEEAFTRFAQALMAEPKGGLILKRLLLDSGSFSNLDSLPLSVRYELVEYLLNTQQIADASALMDSLPEPPEGVSRLNWQMRRARVLVLAGKVEQGQEAVQTILDENPELSVDSTDRLMQVLFDFQAVAAHKEAIIFLDQVGKRGLGPARARELRYWQADSYKGLGLHLEAAHHYLLSAGYINPFSMDQWAQTARFEAAVQLQEAGLREDAQRLYQRLKNVSDDAGRKAMLQTRIDRLGL